jgi:hypothetical protein
VQVSEQVVELLLIHGIAKGGHHAMSVEDDVGDAVVVGRGSAGKILLFIEALQPRSVECPLVVCIVAASAVRDEYLTSVEFLCGEFAEWLGWRQRRAASCDGAQNERGRYEFADGDQGIDSMIADFGGYSVS